ncbi:phosphotransferase [Amycolatopsis sp. NPDC051371]|uniref:phosphotransferase n=1 Tax=Amycolatopsis sp. NPDC051371 TaxID=3155800 RepID=UPI0034180F02
MEHVIRGLMVDDVEKNRNSVSLRLSQQLKMKGWTVNWTMVGDPNEAHRLLADEPPFDLCVIDLLFKREDLDDDEPRGLELVQRAVAVAPGAYVFVISTGDSHRRDLFSKAEELGAHKVLRRAEFSTETTSTSPEAVAAAIRNHLLGNGSVIEVEVRADRTDPAVQALLFEVKEATLTQLHRLVLEATDDVADIIEVKCLVPGASGASVCSTTARVRRGPTVHHVLKVSRAEENLVRETRGALQARQLLPQRFVVPVQPERPVGPVNGWCATGAHLDRHALPLHRWLGTGPAPELVRDLFDLLFSDCLGVLYETTGEDRCGSAPSLLTLPYYKQCLVLRALEELAPLLTHPRGGRLEDATTLIADVGAFVTERRLPGIQERNLPQRSHVCIGHGDLHGGNVLVYPGRHPSPALIDFSEFGKVHWALDPARLAVDLLMYGIDSGPESAFFEGVPVWRKLAAAVGVLSADLRAVSSNPSTTAYLGGLGWLTGQLRQICPKLRADVDFRRNHWEWHLALGSQLLRVSYHRDMPPPKRVAGLIAAHDQLVAAAAAVPERD